jgi:hypothetical protein
VQTGDRRTAVAREQLCEHVSPATREHEIIEKTFSVQFARGYITRTSSSVIDATRVEAGSNTSTVPLRAVGGDEKGSLKSETGKDGHESQGTRTRERLRWLGQQHIQKTEPSSSQRGRHRKTKP